MDYVTNNYVFITSLYSLDCQRVLSSPRRLIGVDTFSYRDVQRQEFCGRPTKMGACPGLVEIENRLFQSLMILEKRLWFRQSVLQVIRSKYPSLLFVLNM